MRDKNEKARETGKNMNTNKFSLVIMILLIQVSLSAQWNFSISTNQEYNSNPFRAVESSGELISTYNYGIEKQFGDFSFLYFGSYSALSQTTDMNYYWHQAGVYAEWENSVVGTYFEQRINKDTYNFYDANLFSLYFRHSLPMDFVNLKFNTAAVYSNYPNLPDFNNLLLNAAVSASKSFESKTTLIGTLLLNYKNYRDEIDTTMMSGSGYGYMRGRRSLLSESSVSVSQLDFNARLAQSLFENTGVAVNFNYKKILSGSGVNAGIIESVYGETELYEDPVTQEGFSVGGMLTQILPFEITLQAGYFYYDKSFPAQGVFTNAELFDDTLVRNDNQNNFYITAAKNFILDEESGSYIQLSFNYNFLNSNSNSYYYNYQRNMMSLNLDFQF